LNYYTYWSVLDLPSNSIKTFDVFLYIAIITMIAWLLIKKLKKQNEDYEKSILLWSIGFLFVLSSFILIYLKLYTIDNSDERIRESLASEQVEQVEGVLSNFNRTFVQKKLASITYESFNVDSVKFSYSNQLLGRFNTYSNTNDDIIKNGLKVRITYRKIDNELLKIEISK
jgi:hypothetical protein